MALIIATDPAPGRAFALILRRCAFVLMPLSVLLIKYYPDIGRYYDAWLGTMYYQGVALTKNGLGATTMLFGVVFVWSIVWRRRSGNRMSAGLALLVDTGALLMALWLLLRTDSATSMFGFLVGAGGSGAPSRVRPAPRRLLDRRRAAGRRLSVALSGSPAPPSLNASAATPRSPTGPSCGQTYLRSIGRLGWELVSRHSGWGGADMLWEKWWWGPLQAHNGYLEIYIQQGFIGLSLYVFLFLVTIARLLRSIEKGSANAVLCFALFFCHSVA